MKTILVVLAAGSALLAAGSTQSISGVITDTMCGASHAMMKGHPDDECVKMCAKGSAEYALYDGKTVWRLSDQKTPATLMAKHVKVTGMVDDKSGRIKVTKIEPAE